MDISPRQIGANERTFLPLVCLLGYILLMAPTGHSSGESTEGDEGRAQVFVRAAQQNSDSVKSEEDVGRLYSFGSYVIQAENAGFEQTVAMVAGVGLEAIDRFLSTIGNDPYVRARAYYYKAELLEILQRSGDTVEPLRMCLEELRSIDVNRFGEDADKAPIMSFVEESPFPQFFYESAQPRHSHSQRYFNAVARRCEVEELTPELLRTYAKARLVATEVSGLHAKQAIAVLKQHLKSAEHPMVFGILNAMGVEPTLAKASNAQERLALLEALKAECVSPFIRRHFLARLGALQMEVGEFKAALDSFHAAIDTVAFGSTLSALPRLGKALEENGEYERAIEAYSIALESLRVSNLKALPDEARKTTQEKILELESKVEELKARVRSGGNVHEGSSGSNSPTSHGPSVVESPMPEAPSCCGSDASIEGGVGSAGARVAAPHALTFAAMALPTPGGRWSRVATAAVLQSGRTDAATPIRAAARRAMDHVEVIKSIATPAM